MYYLLMKYELKSMLLKYLINAQVYEISANFCLFFGCFLPGVASIVSVILKQTSLDFQIKKKHQKSDYLQS